MYTIDFGRLPSTASESRADAMAAALAEAEAEAEAASNPKSKTGVVEMYSAAQRKVVVVNPLVEVGDGSDLLSERNSRSMETEASKRESRPSEGRVNPLFEGLGGEVEVGEERLGSTRRSRSETKRERGRSRTWKLRTLLSVAALFCLVATSLQVSGKFINTMFEYFDLEGEKASNSVAGSGVGVGGAAREYLLFLAREKEEYEACIERQVYSPGGCYKELSTAVEEDERTHGLELERARANVERARDILITQERKLGTFRVALGMARQEVIGTLSGLSPGEEHWLSMSAAIEECSSTLGSGNADGSSSQHTFNEDKENEASLSIGHGVAREKYEEDIDEIFSDIKEDLSLRQSYDILYIQSKVEDIGAIGSHPDLYWNSSLLTTPLEELNANVSGLVASLLDEAFVSVGTYIQNATLQYSLLYRELDFYKSFSERFFSKVQKLVEDMKGFQRLVEKVTKPFESVLPRLDFMSPDFHLDVPEAYTISSPLKLSDFNLSNLRQLELQERMSLEISEAKLDTLRMAKDMAHIVNVTVNASLSGLLEDYNPPSVRLDIYKDGLHNVTRTIFRDAEQRIREAPHNEVSTLMVQRINSSRTSLRSAPSDVASQFFSFHTRFTNVNKGISFLFKSLVTLDLIYRVFSALCTVCRYWSNSSIEKPQLVFEGEGSDRKSPTKYLEHIYAILLQVTTYSSFFAVCFVLTAITFGSFYLPILKHYQEGCINSCDGTFFSKNIFSMSMNLAVSIGKHQELAARRDYKVQYEDTCVSLANTYERKSKERLQEDAALRHLLHRNMERIKGLRQCVQRLSSTLKSSPLQLDKYKNCLKLESMSQDLVGSFHSQRAEIIKLLDNNGSYNDLGFECQLLDHCSITCNGPNPEIMGYKSHTASCYVESHLHAYLGKGMMALISFFFLNLGRMFFFNGLKKMFCDDLSNGFYEVSA